MPFDLANYFNETMFDNTYPGPEKVKFYGDNMMTEREVYALSKRYLEYYFQNYATNDVRSQFQDDMEVFLIKQHKNFIKQIY